MSVSQPHDETSSEQQDGLLTRWQKRKQNVLLEKKSLEVDATDNAELRSTEEITPPTDADMPSLDSLNDESDFKDFMSPNVSEALRKLALRKLFHGSPMNLCDGLDVYDSDYTSFAKLGDVVTADMVHHIERAAKEKLDAETKKQTELAQAGNSDVEVDADVYEHNELKTTETEDSELEALEEETLEEKQFEQPLNQTDIDLMASSESVSAEQAHSLLNVSDTTIKKQLEHKGGVQG